MTKPKGSSSTTTTSKVSGGGRSSNVGIGGTTSNRRNAAATTNNSSTSTNVSSSTSLSISSHQPQRPKSHHSNNHHHHRKETLPKSSDAASNTTGTATSGNASTDDATNKSSTSSNAMMLIRQWLYEIEMQDCDTERVWEELCSYGIDSPTSLVAFFQNDSASTGSPNKSDREYVFSNLITSVFDQRKLQLLIQRIQLLLKQQKQNQQEHNHATLSPKDSIPKENCHPSSSTSSTSTTTRSMTISAASSTTTNSTSSTALKKESSQAPSQPRNKLVKSASQLLEDVLSGTTTNHSSNHPTTSTASTRSQSVSSTTTATNASTTSTSRSTTPKNSSLPVSKLRSSVTPRASSTRSIQGTHSTSNASSFHTTTSGAGISLRTGKQLSSIPSEQVLPMSPFIDNSSNPNHDWLTAADSAVTMTTTATNGKGRRRSHSHDYTTSKQQHRQHDDDNSNDSTSLDTTINHSVRTSRPSQNTNRRTTLTEKLGAQSERHLLSSSNASVISAATTRTSSTQRRQSVLPPDRNHPTNSSRSRSRMSYHPSSLTTATLSTNGNSITGDNSDNNNNNINNNNNNNSAQALPFMTSMSSNSNMSFKFQIEALREETTQEHELNYGKANGNNNHGTMSDDEMRIRVIVRKRPMTTSESNINAGDIDIIHPLQYDQYGRILVYQPKTRVDLTKQIEIVPFAFDNVYDDPSTNQQIYESSIRDLIPSFFIGQWASIFAYGQTGSGKTFTMMGNNFTGMNCSTPANVDVSNLGLYYMAALDIFHALQAPEYEYYSIHVSLFEIYGGKLFDLLNGRAAVKCLEDSKGNVCFPGLSDHPVHNANELMNLIVEGATLRSTGTTSRNADSSRSHAVLQLHLYRKATTINRRRGTTATTFTSSTSRNGKEEYSRLTFIDLAGSERGADTSTASRATRLEGAEINTSLLALKEVIRALATGDSLTHVPFRGSKLTQVLKQSFVGKNCRSVMIACISPNIGNCEQTLNTLRYADRVKERNPETGELSPTMIAATTNKVLTPTKHTLSRLPSLVTDQSHSSQKSDMLDELLASPPSTSDHDADDDDIDALLEENVPLSSMSKIDPPPNVLRELIATHKDATEGMLEMIQEEMSLITVDNTNAQQFDQYLDRVYALQEEQLSMITMLRELLSQYRSMNQPPSATAFHNPLDDMENDDNFEDLRD